ncbi:hypothetical protein BH11MYX2_BH11MYX2_16350 [soil metagenome]
MRKLTVLGLLASALLAACGGGGGTDPTPDAAPGGNIFTPKPECTGASIVPFAGMSPQVISNLEIGAKTDGFDLDGDGDPDNALSAVGSLAADSIKNSLASYDIVIPFEMFDVSGITADDCVKFAIYLGAYDKDKDADGKRPGIAGGDCDDRSAHAAAVHPGATEVVGNFYDDDCDGLADEDASNNPSTSTQDMDGDGVTIAQGDCDDTNAAVKKGAAEICGDGLDNDCDGVADRSVDQAGNATACSPFVATADVPLDPLSFTPGTMTPAITFKDGTIDASGTLTAGPSLFSVAIPVTDGITLDLRISGAQITGTATMENGAVVIKNARLGGVIDAKTADTIRGLSLDSIGLTPESSLLDATFANLLGPLLALPKAGMSVTTKYPGCRTPDIDVDRDGLEAFCDSNPDDDNKNVDVCIDGDGTEVMDVLDGNGAVMIQCSEAKKGDEYRFLDGISVALKFSTSAIHAIKPVEQ